MLPAPLYPTPVRACPELSHAQAELWLKNDGLSHPIYGGNKVRKAERLVAEALRCGAKRVLSFGAAGSHHLLTLTLFARAAGLESVAFPCISTGLYRFPLELAAEIAVAEVRAFMQQPSSLKRVVFCCFSERDLEVYERLLKKG